ncbi:hypothetical protein BS78_01G170100 [Paspalum vaginatum]|nr:hypothetical protein BS78_01G170100 [Paspalum vaginatum]
MAEDRRRWPSRRMTGPAALAEGQSEGERPRAQHVHTIQSHAPILSAQSTRYPFGSPMRPFDSRAAIRILAAVLLLRSACRLFVAPLVARAQTKGSSNATPLPASWSDAAACPLPERRGSTVAPGPAHAGGPSELRQPPSRSVSAPPPSLFSSNRAREERAVDGAHVGNAEQWYSLPQTFASLAAACRGVARARCIDGAVGEAQRS